jgi:hypothetical protein
VYGVIIAIGRRRLDQLFDLSSWSRDARYRFANALHDSAQHCRHTFEGIKEFRSIFDGVKDDEAGQDAWRASL